LRIFCILFYGERLNKNFEGGSNMPKVYCAIGGVLIGAGGVYVGARLTCKFIAYILRQGGEEKVDEFIQNIQECRRKRRAP